MPINDPPIYRCGMCERTFDLPWRNSDRVTRCPYCESDEIEPFLYGPPTKTEWMHQRMRNLPDDVKSRFAINWRIPHTLFNVASKLWPSEDLQNIDWYTIHKSRDLGTWSHGGQVIVQAFR